MNNLPVELHETMARYLPKAEDVVNMRLSGFDINVRWCWFNHVCKYKKNFDMSFEKACINGHLEFVKWLVKELSDKVDNELVLWVFHWTCRKGKLDVAKWLHNKFCISRNQVIKNMNNTFIYSCAEGNLDVAKWIHTTFDITRDLAVMQRVKAFRYACENGYLETAKWFHSVFKLDVYDDIKNNCHNYCIHMTARNGHLEVLKWLDLEFGLDTDDFDDDDGYIIRNVCGKGKLNILKWFHEKQFDIYRNDYLKRGLKKANQAGHLELIEWVVSNIAYYRSDCEMINFG